METSELRRSVDQLASQSVRGPARRPRGHHVLGTVGRSMLLRHQGEDKMTKSMMWIAVTVVACNRTNSPDIGSIGQEINPCPINNGLPVTPQGTVKPDVCDCEPSPIVIDVTGNGFAFTNAAGGVRFDIRGVGQTERIAWPELGSDDAFLALDRNGDGVINSGAELFGNATEQPASAKFANGYNALSVFDENGDGVIDERDAVYSRLLLWQDANHDGISQAEELRGLAEMGVAALSLQYSVSKKADRYGNQFHYRANVYGTPGSHVGRYSYDVFPAVDGMDIGEDGAVDIERELAKTARVAPSDVCGGTPPSPTDYLPSSSDPRQPPYLTCGPAARPPRCGLCPGDPALTACQAGLCYKECNGYYKCRWQPCGSTNQCIGLSNHGVPFVMDCTSN